TERGKLVVPQRVGSDEQRHHEAIEVEPRLAHEIAERRGPAQPPHPGSGKRRHALKLTSMDRVVASARCAVVVLLVAGIGAASGTGAAGAAKPACSVPGIPSDSAASVRRVLAHGRDVWGTQLLHSPAGPTYDGAARKLKPLLLAAGPKRRLVTDTGAYYLPFGWPSQFGARTV